MAASREQRQISPFVAGQALPYSARLSEAAYENLSAGLIPLQMEDRWFVFFEQPYLYFHRSWTGEPVYRLKVERSGDATCVTEALWETSLAEEAPEQVSYQAELLDFLMSNLLLGMSKPFPQPPGVPGPPGLFQHHVAGTCYAERPAGTAAPTSSPS